MACGQTQYIPHELQFFDIIISILNKKHGKEAPLTVLQVKVYKYLIIMTYFSLKGKVIIWMDDYINKNL